MDTHSIEVELKNGIASLFPSDFSFELFREVNSFNNVVYLKYKNDRVLRFVIPGIEMIAKQNKMIEELRAFIIESASFVSRHFYNGEFGIFDIQEINISINKYYEKYIHRNPYLYNK